MDGFITIDTMYLSVKYPKMDVFKKWYRYVEDIDHRKLKEGVAVNNFVIRGGSSGYKISVWQFDARAFLTDLVDEKCGKGRGMGIWLQLGPKFILHHINELNKAVSEFLYSIGVEEEYPIKITRLDLAIDLLGVAMVDQDINLWQSGWVGRSKVSGVFYNSRTGDLETLNIGSRASPVFLRIYDKVAQAVKEGDYEYWQDVWKGYSGPVTRIEWEIKPNEGHFSNDLKDFTLFNGLSICELLNYLLQKWGRLCIPNPSDSNNRRWLDSPFWQDLRGLAEIWVKGITWPTSRLGKEFHGISEQYVMFVAGTLSGAMARICGQYPTIKNFFTGMEQYGQSWELINRKAVAKAKIYSNL